MLKTCQKSLVLPMNNVSVCAFKTSPFVPAPRAHMFQHVCAWCRYKRGRFERTHGDVLSGHTGFFQCATPQTTHHTPPHNTEQHTTTHGDRDRQRQTETEEEDRERRQGQRENRRRKRRDKTREEETKEKKTRQQKREDSFSVWWCIGGVNRLVNFVDDRDLCLLYCVKYDSYLITGFIVQSAHYRIR